ncbi:MAG TPA: hypothetical protein VJO34_02485 [Methylomirabilota bacterium]|nr:hypothetical protein [Methylomirabilota bacterium]
MTARSGRGAVANPFDDVIKAIRAAGYHNHRLEQHSDLLSAGIFRDLVKRCPQIASDYRSGRIACWYNVPAPGARGRRVDLFVGEPSPSGKYNARGARICVENKSVITAHRNKTNRLDDLDEVVRGTHRVKPESIIVATVLVGTALTVLNIPDHVRKRYRNRPDLFESKVLPRLSKGDQSLWREFKFAVSRNRENDPQKTVDAFRTLPTRAPGHTHVLGYDFILLAPVFIDNVNPPRINRKNTFGIDVDREYQRMLETICRAYEARWHL